MAAKFEIDKEYNGAYLVDRQLLQEIFRIMTEYAGKRTSVRIKLAGGETISGSVLADVIEDASFGINTIARVDISCSDYDSNRSASINFNTSYFLKPIEVSISGDRHAVSAPLGEIDQRVRASETVYSNFLKIWGMKSKLFLTLIIFLLSKFYFFNQKWLFDHFVIKPKEFFQANILLSMAFGALIYISMSIIDIFNLFFCPAMVFLFGKSEKNYKQRVSAFKYIFGSVIVAALIGYFVNIYSK